MMRLEGTWFVAAFHSTPVHDPGADLIVQATAQEVHRKYYKPRLKPKLR